MFSIRRYFRKFENYIPDRAQPSIDASSKGTSGPVRVGYVTAMFRSSKAFVQACLNLGIPYCPDFNSSGSIGVNRVGANTLLCDHTLTLTHR